MQLANHDKTATQRERPSALRLVQIGAHNPYMVLGLAVRHLMGKLTFSRLRFSDWSRVLVGQVNRRHYYFVMDEKSAVQGFLGWALTTEDKAEAWLAGRAGLSDADSRAGIASSSMPGRRARPRPGACCSTPCVGSAWASRRTTSSAITRTAPRVQCA